MPKRIFAEVEEGAQMKTHHASTIKEAIDDFETFLLCDMWYSKENEWKTEKDMEEYITGHIDILRKEIRIAMQKTGSGKHG
jgi:hypothetical protein